MLQKYIQVYCNGIIRIIENNKQFEIPLNIQKALVAIQFIQVAGYVLTLNAANSLVETKISALNLIVEVSTGTYFLYFEGQDQLTWAICIVMNIFLTICVIFSFFIGSLSDKSKLINSAGVQYIASVINIFLTLYNWVFIVSYIEINMGLLTCGQQSFLVSQRQNCQQSWYIIGIGMYGAFLTLLTALSVLYFFRNYQFDEKMKLKRKFNIAQFIQVLQKFVLVILNYQLQKSSTKEGQQYLTSINYSDLIQNIFSFSYVLVCCYDVLYNLPYLSNELSRFFILCLSLNIAQILNFQFWQIFHIFYQNELFYTFCMISSLTYYFILSIYNRKQEFILKTMAILTAKKSLTDLENADIEACAFYFDFFIEQFMEMCETSLSNEDSKFKVFQFLRTHIENCEHQSCHCKERYFQKLILVEKEGSKQSIKKKRIYEDFDFSELTKFNESIFKIFINTNQIIDSATREHLTLKYVSFINKHLNNAKKSYYELKILKKQKKNNNFQDSNSFYFLLIEKIFSSKLYERLQQQFCQIQKQSKNYNQLEGTIKKDRKINLDIGISANFSIKLDPKIVFTIDEVVGSILPKILDVAEQKYKFWRNFTEIGYKKLESMRQDLLKTIFLLKNKQTYINLQLQTLQSGYVWTQSTYFIRLMQLIDIIVNNDIVLAQKRQTQILEIQNRELTKGNESYENKKGETNIDFQSNTKQLNNELICIVTSISKENIGKLLLKSESLYKFFGFNSKQDFSVIDNIKQLMPHFIASQHDQFVLKFLEYEEAYSAIPKQQAQRSNLQPGINLINGKTKSFAKNYKGFIFPVQIQVDIPLTINQNQFIFISTLLKLQSKQEYVLFNQQGQILGFSENILNLLFRQAKKVPSCMQAMNQLNFHSLFYGLISSLCDKREFIQRFIQAPISTFFNQQELSDTDTLGEIILEENSKTSIELFADPFSVHNQLDQFLKRQVYLKKSLNHIQKNNVESSPFSKDSSQFVDSNKNINYVHSRSKMFKSIKTFINSKENIQAQFKYDLLDQNVLVQVNEFFSKRVQSLQSLKSTYFKHYADTSSKGTRNSIQTNVIRPKNQEIKYLQFEYNLYQCCLPVYLNQLFSKTNNQVSENFQKSLYFKLCIKNIQVITKEQIDRQQTQNSLAKSTYIQSFNNYNSVDYSKTGVDSYRTVKSISQKQQNYKLGRTTETSMLDSQNSKASFNTDNDMNNIQKSQINTSSYYNAQDKSPSKSFQVKRMSPDNISQSTYFQQEQFNSLKPIQEEHIESQQGLFPTESDRQLCNDQYKKRFDQYNQMSLEKIVIKNQKQQIQKQNSTLNFKSGSLQNIKVPTNEAKSAIDSFQLAQERVDSPSVSHNNIDDTGQHNIIESNFAIQSNIQNEIRKVDSDDHVVRDSFQKDMLFDGEENNNSMVSIKYEQNQSHNHNIYERGGQKQFLKSFYTVVGADLASTENQRENIDEKEENEEEDEVSQDEEQKITASLNSQKSSNQSEKADQAEIADLKNENKMDKSSKKLNIKKIFKKMQKFGKHSIKIKSTHNGLKENKNMMQRSSNINSGIIYIKDEFSEHLTILYNNTDLSIHFMQDKKHDEIQQEQINKNKLLNIINSKMQQERQNSQIKQDDLNSDLSKQIAKDDSPQVRSKTNSQPFDMNYTQQKNENKENEKETSNNNLSKDYQNNHLEILQSSFVKNFQGKNFQKDVILQNQYKEQAKLNHSFNNSNMSFGISQNKNKFSKQDDQSTNTKSFSRQNSGMISPINVNYSAIQLHFIAANLIVFCNLAAFDQYLNDYNNSFAQFYDTIVADLPDLKEQINQYLVSIPNYESQLLNQILELSFYSKSQIDNLLQLLKGNICPLVNSLGNVLTAQLECSNNTSTNYFQQGTLGAIESMKTLIGQYQQTIFSQNIPNKSDIYSFLNSSLHIEYFIKGFDLLIQVFSNLSSQINDSNIQIINDFSTTIKQYFYIFGILLIIVILTLITYNIYLTKKEINGLRQSLKIIPYEYFNDDKMIQILKKINSL
ncbi:hypothetical protein ABPG74_022011 [Tetrahymena malaccensis]